MVFSKRGAKVLQVLFLLTTVFSVLGSRSMLGENKARGNKNAGLMQMGGFPTYTCKFQGPFPYMVSVRGSSGQHICGGVLISENAILTSAHCVDKVCNNVSPVAPTLYLGGATGDDPVEVRFGTKIFFAPNWNGNIFTGSNLAIVKLDEKTCLRPVPYLGNFVNDSKELLVTGFGGLSEDTAFSYMLQIAPFRAIDNMTCQLQYKLPQGLNNQQICVVNSICNCASICEGDEGSPMIERLSTAEFSDTLIGIASYTSGECTSTDAVAIFINVQDYTNWIQMTLQSQDFISA